jgi:hypothetical protein
MIAFGVISFVMGGDSFTTQAPDGTVTGDTFFGVEGNGWTNALWAAAGLLLLLGAPAHWGAKTMAILVGIALGAAALIAVSDGSDVFGVVAANDLTMLLWGACAVGLLLLALLPRVGGRRKEVVHDDRHARPERVERTGRFRRDRDRDVVRDDRDVVRDDRDVVRDRDVVTDGRHERGGFRRL